MSYYLRCLNERPALYKDDALVHKQVQHMLLLAYLERQGKQSRLHVANIFWPHFDKEKRLKYLSEALRLIEKAVPGAVQKEDSNGQHLWVELSSDVQRLQQAIADEDYAFVLDLPTFHYLPQLEYNQRLNIEDKALLHDWLIAEREAVSNMAQEALLKLAERYVAQEHYQPVASLARRAYQLRKTLPLLLPVTYQRIYQLLRASDDIFYVTVAQEALAAYGQQAIARWPQSQQEARQALASPYKLPYVAHKVVGRDDDIIECLTVLKARTRLLTIHGTAGMGKTYLGLALARRLRGYSFAEDGVFWLELETIHTATDLLLELATILNANISSNQQAHEAIIRSIGTRKLVLVLDNFEHLVNTHTLLSGFLAACPHLRLVVTSRIIVGNSWEYIYRIKGLAYLSQEQEKLQGEQIAIQNYAAVQLFLQQAEQHLGRLHLDAAQQSALLRICQLVQGMPLGLCLAASWLPNMTLEAIALELEHSPLLLQGEASQDKARHKNMQYAFEVSWRLLSLTEKSLYSKLSVFAGGFSLRAAQQIADASTAALKKLQEKALLSWNSVTSRYTLHPLMRQTAQTKLQSTPEVYDTVTVAHAAYYLDFLTAIPPRMAAPEHDSSPKETFAMLKAEWANIRKAWLSVEQISDENTIIWAAFAVMFFAECQGMFFEAYTILDKVLTRLKKSQHSSHVQAEVLGSLCWACFRTGQYSKAVDYAKQTQEILESALENNVLDYPSWGLWSALEGYGMSYYITGNIELCESYLYQATDLMTRYQGMAWEKSTRMTIDFIKTRTLNAVALFEALRGDYARATLHLQEAYALSLKWHMPGLCSTYWVYGIMFLYQGTFASALDYLAKGLQITLEEGMETERIHIQLEMARAYLGLGDFIKAQELAHAVRQDSIYMSNPWVEAQAEAVIANACALLIQVTRAQEHALRSIECFASMQAPHFTCEALVVLIGIFLEPRKDKAAFLLGFIQQFKAYMPEILLGQMEQLQHQLDSTMIAENFASSWLQGKKADIAAVVALLKEVNI